MIENKKLLIINKGALPDEYVTFLNKKGINAILLQFSPQKKYIYKRQPDVLYHSESGIDFYSGWNCHF